MPERWAAVLRVAASLGLRPGETWALSLAEWRALTAPAPGAAPLTRAELGALLHSHPDDPA